MRTRLKLTLVLGLVIHRVTLRSVWLRFVLPRLRDARRVTTWNKIEVRNIIFNARSCLLLLLLVWSGCPQSEAQNIAGFYKKSFPTGYSLWTTELAGWPVPASSLTNIQFSGTNGPANGDTIFTMDAGGFKADNYLNGWSDPNLPLPLGSSWYFKNPNPALPFTALGFLYAGTNHLNSGFSAAGSLLPLSGGLSSNLYFSAAVGDSVFVFSPAGNSYVLYSYSNQWLPMEPQMDIGQGLWVNHAAAADWVQPAFLMAFGSVSMVQPQLASSTGQLNFFTFNATNSAFGQVFDTNATALSANGLGQVYAGTNADGSSLLPVGMPTAFSSAANGYVNYGVLTVPFASGGQAVYAQLRAWKAADGSSYEAASAQGGAVGKSSLMLLTAHATIEGNQPGLPPPDVNVFPSFSLMLPVALVPPVIQSIIPGNGMINITWGATAGANYQMQYKTNLSQTNWINLGGVLTATNGAVTGQDPAPTDAQRFYRVITLPP